MKTVSSFGTRMINKRKLWMKNSNSIKSEMHHESVYKIEIGIEIPQC